MLFVYRISLPNIEYDNQIWNMITKYGISLPNMEYHYQIWNMITKYGTSLPNMEYDYQISREHKGQRGSLAVMPLGYFNFTKSIFRNTIEVTDAKGNTFPVPIDTVSGAV